MLNKLVIHSQNHLRFVSLDEIIFCKSDNCYTFINLADGDRLLVSKSLAKFAKELEQTCFVRVSQSYLINVNYIRSIDKKDKQIELVDRSRIQFTTTIKELLCLIGCNPVPLILFHNSPGHENKQEV